MTFESHSSSSHHFSKQRPSWEALDLSDEALDLVQKAGYGTPSPVQWETIPLALEGHDLIASAQTGTGKTASFVLPMTDVLAGKSGTFGLILAPTREIAQQIQASIEIFGTPRGIRSIVLIGGIDMEIDLKALRTYPQIIVATPGRLCDHLDRGTVWLEFIEMFVLDEADRMLNMGFADQLARITEELPHSRQTLLFSATIHPAVEKLAQKILYKPKKVSIGKPLSAAKTVSQSLLWMREESKSRELYRIIREERGSIIVFVRSKIAADKLWRSLHSRGLYEVTCIHSDRIQSAREQALADFKEGKYRVLIATDVVGRGIHVDGVAHVINYDLPLEPEDYVHRIGRTGRQEATGKATSFVTNRDSRLLGQIEKILKYSIPAEYADPINGGRPQPHSRNSHKGERRPHHRHSQHHPRSGHQSLPTVSPLPAQEGDERPAALDAEEIGLSQSHEDDSVNPALEASSQPQENQSGEGDQSQVLDQNQTQRPLRDNSRRRRGRRHHSRRRHPGMERNQQRESKAEAHAAEDPAVESPKNPPSES